MANFAVTLTHGPGWDDARPIREQDDWDAHAAFMDGLVDDGLIIIGGPIGDGHTTLHAVEATGEDEVRARFGADPWAIAGLLQIGSIDPWALWLDGRRSTARGPDGQGLDGRGLDGRDLDGQGLDGRVRR